MIRFERFMNKIKPQSALNFKWAKVNYRMTCHSDDIPTEWLKVGGGLISIEMNIAFTRGGAHLPIAHALRLRQK